MTLHILSEYLVDVEIKIMEEPELIINNIILHILLGTAGSMSVGFMVFQTAIFNLKLPAFQFIAFGVICTVFYSARKYFPPKIYITVLLILFVLYVFTAGSMTTKIVIRDKLYIGGIGYTIHFFLKLIEQKRLSFHFGNFLVFASLMTISYIIITLILFAIFTPENFKQILFLNINLGFLIGLGVGLGLDLSEYLIDEKIKR